MEIRYERGTISVGLTPLDLKKKGYSIETIPLLDHYNILNLASIFLLEPYYRETGLTYTEGGKLLLSFEYYDTLLSIKAYLSHSETKEPYIIDGNEFEYNTLGLAHVMNENNQLGGLCVCETCSRARDYARLAGEGAIDSLDDVEDGFQESEKYLSPKPPESFVASSDNQSEMELANHPLIKRSLKDIVYRFKDIDEFIPVSRVLEEQLDGVSLYSLEGYYYAVIEDARELRNSVIVDVHSIFSEYNIELSKRTLDYLQEYGQLIVEGDAFEVIATAFRR